MSLPFLHKLHTQVEETIFSIFHHSKYMNVEGLGEQGYCEDAPCRRDTHAGRVILFIGSSLGIEVVTNHLSFEWLGISGSWTGFAHCGGVAGLPGRPAERSGLGQALYPEALTKLYCTTDLVLRAIKQTAPTVVQWCDGNNGGTCC